MPCSKSWLFPNNDKLFRTIKGIIFDFDGTLFDNARIPFYLILAYPPDWLRIWRERLVRNNFAGCDYASPEEYYQAFFAAMGNACSRSPEQIRDWYFNRYMPRMARVLKKHYKPRPEVIELFNLLDAGLSKSLPADHPKIAIYSDYPFLKKRLEALGLTTGPRILLYGPESFGAQKPAARPFLRIAGDLGAAPEEVLVIGDRPDTDGLGASRAGMRFFHLETGHKRYYRLDPYRRPPLKEEPSLLIHAGSWDELIILLIKRFNPPAY